jgi:uncharacterized protein (TIGR02266 family)
MSNMPGLLRAFMSLDKRRKAGGLSPADIARWSQLKNSLSHHFEPGVDEKHAKSRASVRIPLALNVNFESLGEVRKCMMKNLSAGGIFVATESPLPIGTPFNVRIRIERTGEEVELPGEVVSIGVSANLSQEEHGMGIRFVHLTTEQEEKVAEFSEEAMKNAIIDPPEEPADES